MRAPLPSLLRLLPPIAIFLGSASPSAAAPGVIVVGGGGPEGEIGETTAWSYKLYKNLIDNGDINGDGKIKVVVISNDPPSTPFMIHYLKSMGATSSENLVIRSRKDAQNPKFVKTVENADVIFLRGGDQAESYRNWKNTRLQRNIRKVLDAGGAIGGTSSGAMSLAGYALAGGQNLTSADVLTDSHSPLLLDKKTGGSSIHHDFLNVVPDAIIDTHVGERARLGRLMGVHAKAIEDSGNSALLAIGIEERTGIAIRDGKAQVYGTGAVQFIQRTPDTRSIRRPGRPLSYTDVRLDSLTEGWIFDLQSKKPDTDHLPQGAAGIQNSEDCLAPKSLSTKPALEIRNALSTEEHKKGGTIQAQLHAQAFQELFQNPERPVLLIPGNGTAGNRASSTLVLDCSKCTFKSRSSFVSNFDDGSGTDRSPGLVNIRVHALGETGAESLAAVSQNYRVEETQTSSELECRALAEERTPIQLAGYADIFHRLNRCQ